MAGQLHNIVADLLPLLTPIGELHLDPANARTGHDVERIAASLRQYGQRKPIVVNRSEANKVEAGNGTLQAARLNGWTHVAAVFVEDDPMTAVGYAIADNRTAELSRWDLETLQTLMAGIDPEMETGFAEGELEALLRAAGLDGGDGPALEPGDAEPDVDRAEELAAEWGVRPGQVWRLPSRVELYEGFIRVAIEHAIRPDAAWYCWHASRRQAMLEGVWEQFGAFVHQQIIWVKDRPVLTRSHYMWQHEPCFFGWVRPHRPPRVAEDYPSTVWEFPTTTAFERTDHPTQKPVELFQIPMLQHTRPGEICYEPFSGSGTQIVAGENLGRPVRACEKKPGFVAVALDRYLRAFEIRGELVEAG